MTGVDAPLPPGSTIGILGGGQLGRMLALAAARLGMKTHIYCPDPQSPAFDVTPRATVAAYEDEAALAAFAARVDVVTYEFENVPLAAVSFLGARKPVRPGARALADVFTCIREKTHLDRAGRRLAANGERGMRDGRAMARLFADLPDAVAASTHHMRRKVTGSRPEAALRGRRRRTGRPPLRVARRPTADRRRLD